MYIHVYVCVCVCLSFIHTYVCLYYIYINVCLFVCIAINRIMYICKGIVTRVHRTNSRLHTTRTQYLCVGLLSPLVLVSEFNVLVLLLLLLFCCCFVLFLYVPQLCLYRYVHVVHSHYRSLSRSLTSPLDFIWIYLDAFVSVQFHLFQRTYERTVVASVYRNAFIFVLFFYFAFRTWFFAVACVGEYFLFVFFYFYSKSWWVWVTI